MFGNRYTPRDPERTRPTPTVSPGFRLPQKVGEGVAVPKRTYVRSKALLAAIRELPCMHTGVQGRTQPAHSNWSDLGGKGRSIKASDEYCAALSVEVHRELDQGKKWSEAERREIWTKAWRKTVKALLRAGTWPQEVPVPDLREFDA